ncbi:MAG: BrnT family toxin [Pyrinomonadaceae bacterium]
MRYDFDWDIKKAKSNLLKHEISFERATNVFRDPNALSIPDDEHSETEERWLTIAIDNNGILLVVSHTFVEASEIVVKIRIISVRKATKAEVNQYEKGI